MNKTIHNALFITLLIFFIVSCRNKGIPFNKTGWNEVVDAKPCSPLRELMIDDLLTNHRIKGLTYKQLVFKLGNPDNIEFTGSNLLRYEIKEDNGVGDIVHIEALDFYFAKDSIITSWRIVKYDVDM